MSREMTKEEAQAWRDRWEVMAALEREELRRTSPEEKLRRCAALMASGRQMGWLGDRRYPVEPVWEIWRRLKEHHAG